MGKATLSRAALLVALGTAVTFCLLTLVSSALLTALNQ